MSESAFLVVKEKSGTPEPAKPDAHGPGDGSKKKACSRCGHDRAIEKFTKMGRGDRRRAECRYCERDRKISYVYGMDVDDYRSIIIAQGFSCAVCAELFSDTNVPCVDHDHVCCPGSKSCGRCNRGIVCHRCNKVLGLVSDDSDILERMMEYLHDRSTVEA